MRKYLLLILISLCLVGCNCVNLKTIPQNAFAYTANSKTIHLTASKKKYLAHFYSPWKDSYKAITVRATNLRLLPTDSPIFDEHHFDIRQIAFLDINTPLSITKLTADGKWIFVNTPYKCIGWVKGADIVHVNNAFVKKWRSHQYIVALEDDNNAGTRIGELFPLIKTTPQYYQVLTATKVINLPKNIAAPWPLPITTKNLATMVNKFIGNPYGWGDMHGYRDCSETMKDLFAPFAIWLPRNSADQAHTGKFTSLAGLSNAQKEKYIIKHGQPFLTLIWVPGHILLYIGEKNGQAYVFHEPWALHIKKPLSFWDKRVIIGRAVITPLDFGDGYSDNIYSYIDITEGMNLLVPR